MTARGGVMARAVRQVRTFSGFTTLTQTTQSVNLTPFNMPDNSTLTRLEGSVHWDFAPQTDTSTTAAALMVFGFGCFTVPRSEEHTSELQSLMRISYAVFCLKKK